MNPMVRWWRSRSLRSQLMLGILVPVLLLVLVNSAVLYRQALRAADTAYDRTLLATAKSIGETLEMVGEGERARVRATLGASQTTRIAADNDSGLPWARPPVARP